MTERSPALTLSNTRFDYNLLVRPALVVLLAAAMLLDLRSIWGPLLWLAVFLAAVAFFVIKSETQVTIHGEGIVVKRAVSKTEHSWTDVHHVFPTTTNAGAPRVGLTIGHETVVLPGGLRHKGQEISIDELLAQIETFRERTI